VIIRHATHVDAALLAEHRAAVWHEAGGWSRADLALQTPIWATFFGTCLKDSTYVAFIAEEHGRVIGSGGVLVYLAIPRPGCVSERAGRVQSLYVIPEARRRGIARHIVQHVIAYAREARLLSLVLHPSDAARNLYLALGFMPADEMQLRFTSG
jgi:GNAT superfamily N-acetyltransferase